MRVSIGLHMFNNINISKAIQTYNLMSIGKFIHASPTLFNSGTNFPQLSSCFLLGADDSISSIFDTIKNCAEIAKLQEELVFI